MRGLVWIIIAAYGAIQLSASVAGWRGGLLSRGAFVTMAGGSLMLIAGGWLDGRQAAAGLWLIGAGLVLISDSAYYVGTQRPGGPRLSHHVVRAALALMLFGGAWLA